MSDICIKVDVDTYKGLKEGVPRLLKVFDEFDIKATFYVTLGPDNSGKAIMNLIRPSFIKKMFKTRATKSYGIKTALYGTIIRAPILMTLNENLLQITKRFHEVEYHAWDHRYWQDNINKLTRKEIQAWFEKGISAYFSIYNHYPKSFGAPGWVCSPKALDFIKNLKFIKFLSLSRATEPFIEEKTKQIEIPSNLPCLEENPKNFIEITTKAINRIKIGVLPVHAEIEGGSFIDEFIKLLKLLKPSTNFLTMQDYFAKLNQDKLQLRQFRSALLPGRTFNCLV